MTLYPVYPRLLDQLLFRQKMLHRLKNLHRLQTEDEYGFVAVSSNWPFRPYENQTIIGPENTRAKIPFEPYTAKSVCKEKETPIPINQTLTKAAAKKKCVELNATLCKASYS